MGIFIKIIFTKMMKNIAQRTLKFNSL